VGEIHRLPEKKPDPISEEQEEREYLEAQRSAAATPAPLDNPSRPLDKRSGPQGSGAESESSAEATGETGNAEPPTSAQVPFKPRQGKQRARRQRLETETFARIPHARSWKLHRHGISSAGWMIMLELDRLILKGGGKNPVRLSNARLREQGGISRHTKYRQLHLLEKAGAIKVLSEEQSNASLLVLHRWFPEED
jgi:hypothetical protein